MDHFVPEYRWSDINAVYGQSWPGDDPFEGGDFLADSMSLPLPYLSTGVDNALIGNQFDILPGDSSTSTACPGGLDSQVFNLQIPYTQATLPQELPPPLGLEFEAFEQTSSVQSNAELESLVRRLINESLGETTKMKVQTTIKSSKRQPRIQSGYRCEITNCDKVFHCNGELTKHHKRKHLPEEARPLGCEHCTRRFVDRKDLKRHLEGVHPQIGQSAGNREDAGAKPRRILDAAPNQAPILQPTTHDERSGQKRHRSCFARQQDTGESKLKRFDSNRPRTRARLSSISPSVSSDTNRRKATHVRVKLNYNIDDYAESLEERTAKQRLSFVEKQIFDHLSGKQHQLWSPSGASAIMVAIKGSILLVAPAAMVLSLSCDFNEQSDLKMRFLRIDKQRRKVFKEVETLIAANASMRLKAIFVDSTRGHPRIVDVMAPIALNYICEVLCRSIGVSGRLGCMLEIVRKFRTIGPKGCVCRIFEAPESMVGPMRRFAVVSQLRGSRVCLPVHTYGARTQPTSKCGIIFGRPKPSRRSAIRVIMGSQNEQTYSRSSPESRLNLNGRQIRSALVAARSISSALVHVRNGLAE